MKHFTLVIIVLALLSSIFYVLSPSQVQSIAESFITIVYASDDSTVSSSEASSSPKSSTSAENTLDSTKSVPHSTEASNPEESNSPVNAPGPTENNSTSTASPKPPKKNPNVASTPKPAESSTSTIAPPTLPSESEQEPTPEATISPDTTQEPSGDFEDSSNPDSIQISVPMSELKNSTSKVITITLGSDNVWRFTSPLNPILGNVQVLIPKYRLQNKTSNLINITSEDGGATWVYKSTQNTELLSSVWLIMVLLGLLSLVINIVVIIEMRKR